MAIHDPHGIIVGNIEALYHPTPETLPFWEGCSHGQLWLPQCCECRTVLHPFDSTCSVCLGPKRNWIQASGDGRMITWVIYRRSYNPAFTLPYVVALIALSEGPHIISNLVDCSEATIKAGMPVRIVFDQLTDRIVLPRFRPHSILLEADTYDHSRQIL